MHHNSAYGIIWSLLRPDFGIEPCQARKGVAKSALSSVRFGVSATEDLGTDLEPSIAESNIGLLMATTAAH